jgi:hypothetical protein
MQEKKNRKPLNPACMRKPAGARFLLPQWLDLAQVQLLGRQLGCVAPVHVASHKEAHACDPPVLQHSTRMLENIQTNGYRDGAAGKPWQA